MNEELIKHQLEVQETRLNDHSKRIERLEIAQAESNTMIKNLCEKIEGQTKAIYWLMGILGTSFVGFFFYAVQQNIFK